jgi:hypothetical protein
MHFVLELSQARQNQPGATTAEAFHVLALQDRKKKRKKQHHKFPKVDGMQSRRPGIALEIKHWHCNNSEV